MLHKGNQVQVSVDSIFPFGVFRHLVSDGSQDYIAGATPNPTRGLPLAARPNRVT
jgi:hypothetical protein